MDNDVNHEEGNHFGLEVVKASTGWSTLVHRTFCYAWEQHIAVEARRAGGAVVLRDGWLRVEGGGGLLLRRQRRPIGGGPLFNTGCLLLWNVVHRWNWAGSF